MPKPIDAVIMETPLRTTERLRVALGGFRGQQYVHCRRWYQDDDSERWLPGKGLAVRADLLPWLRAALQEAEAAALEGGLLELEDYTEHDLPVPPALAEAA